MRLRQCSCVKGCDGSDFDRVIAKEVKKGISDQRFRSLQTGAVSVSSPISTLRLACSANFPPYPVGFHARLFCCANASPLSSTGCNRIQRGGTCCTPVASARRRLCSQRGPCPRPSTRTATSAPSAPRPTTTTTAAAQGQCLGAWHRDGQTKVELVGRISRKALRK